MKSKINQDPYLNPDSVLDQLNRAQAFAGSSKARKLYRDAYGLIVHLIDQARDDKRRLDWIESNCSDRHETHLNRHREELVLVFRANSCPVGDVKSLRQSIDERMHPPT
jgi:hypothetical protein